MKTLVIVVLLMVAIQSILFAQTDSLVVTKLEATVYTSYFDLTKQKLQTFIKERSIKILGQNESVQEVRVRFYLNDKDFKDLDILLSSLGFLAQKEISTVNNNDIIEKIRLEQKYLKEQKKAYEVEIANMPKTEARYYQYWEKIRDIENQLFMKDKEITGYLDDHQYEATITIKDETVDLTNDRISWVNMPGATYEMLFVENPQSDLSAKMYQGYALRWLFTRGKSYVTVGALKGKKQDPNNENRYDELFMFSFGQDFYTKHFGRGRNKFLNLYTGYNLGGMYATADVRHKTFGYGKLILGVELFKNRYVLIDCNGGYMIPMYYNRNLRGLTFNTAFNFVF